jgi:hypothetical protein
LVRKNFDFLKHDYGFENLPKGIGYVKDKLEVEFFHGNGELDIIFFVNRDDEIFRPYISRIFDFFDIAERLGSEKLIFPEDWPRYVINNDDIEACLSYCAELMKGRCRNLLEGDMSIFETIHLARRQNA